MDWSLLIIGDGELKVWHDFNGSESEMKEEMKRIASVDGYSWKNITQDRDGNDVDVYYHLGPGSIQFIRCTEKGNHI